jgi:hypothetical protein
VHQVNQSSRDGAPGLGFFHWRLLGNQEAVRGMSPGACRGLASVASAARVRCGLSPANHWNRPKLEEAPAEKGQGRMNAREELTA